MTKLYRFMSLKRFKELVEKKELVLVKPSMWEDPYESYIYKALQDDIGRSKIKDLNFARLGKETYDDEFIQLFGDNYYGQCWTETNDSDAMWRIYSYENTTIRVEVMLEDLKELSNHGPKVIDGKVSYVSDMSLEKEVEKVFFKDHVNALNVYLTKRKEFEHENEHRIMIFNHLGSSSNILPLAISNVETFIKSVMLHPQAADELNEEMIKYCNKMNLNYIGKSKLYEVSF
ncbi:MAG: DUF2971 domain-containing protein [Clostridiales bacterium]|nr:DUF2971 domain-containing protein [Clostridiales bacterium]